MTTATFPRSNAFLAQQPGGAGGQGGIVITTAS